MEMVGRITRKHDFEAVLVRDVSRFGRFTDRTNLRTGVISSNSTV